MTSKKSKFITRKTYMLFSCCTITSDNKNKFGKSIFCSFLPNTGTLTGIDSRWDSVKPTKMLTSHVMTKPSKWHVCAVKTQISLGIHLVWADSVASGGPNLSSYGKQRLWSDWGDAQADLSLCWTHSQFVDFVMRWLTCVYSKDWEQSEHLCSLISHHEN